MKRITTPLFGAAASALLLAACQTADTQQASFDESQPAVTDAADPAEPAGLEITVHEGDFATIQEFTTPGGVSVWLVEEPSIPIMALRMAWETGEATDPDGLEGLTDAMVYQMNEGAGELDSLAFATRMEELNMGFSCGAGNETTYCSANMLTDNAGEAMDLVALALNEPRFDEGPFERFRREALIGLKTRETNASYLAGRAANQALMPNHPFSRETSEESLTALTPALALERKDEIMVKDGLLVTAVGAMSPEELAPLLDAAFAGLPESSDIAPIEDVDLNAPLPNPAVVDLPQPQSLVTFTAPGIARDDDDFFPAYVLNYTFGGGGFESRLMKDLRVEKGLTYGVYTGLQTGDHLNLWSGGGQTKNESAGAFIEGLEAEMTDIVENGITEAELSDAKAYLTGSYPLSFDSNSKIASNLMGVRQEELGIDYFDRRNAMVEAVTLEDVNRIAAEYLKPENFTYIVVGQPEGLEAVSELPAADEDEVSLDDAADMEEHDEEETRAMPDPGHG
ncbi:M16 family metallopeptidase [Henriciella aquimarina]|uniref:M16 family metallopeptidase n=1 Tax=Henriciella aquimarina TaxID=545261 RepID=UPI000A04272D|nr:pitrilysin family protein [Henriciella aquimarina]